MKNENRDGHSYRISAIRRGAIMDVDVDVDVDNLGLD